MPETSLDGQARQSPVRQPVAVLVSRFPLITETFILREITEMERQGQPVVLVPMIRENPDVVHEEALPWVDRALYTPFFSRGILASNSRAWMTRPGTMLRLLGWLIFGALLRPATMARSLLLFPKSVHLAGLLSGAGVAHMHAHFATHPTTMAVIISALTGISYSFTVHAHDIFIERSLLRRKVRDARFIRSISLFNKAFLENLYSAEAGEKIEVVHVGIEPGEYDVPAKARLDRPARILCVAAMRPYKGIPHLLEACRLLSDQDVDFRCDIIGSGPLLPAIRRTIARHRLDDRVRLHGAMPQRKVTAAVRQADIFVLPSVVASNGQMEGIPVALMEAMASRRPVIASALSGIPELVEDHVTGLLTDPANPRQLAAAIGILLESPTLRSKLAENGRRKVEASFTLSTTVRELIALLDRVNPPAGPDVEEVVDRIRTDGISYGLRQVHRRADSVVLELLCGSAAGTSEIIVKRQASREGESRPPEVRSSDEYRRLQELSAWFARTEREDFVLGVPEPIDFHEPSATLVMSRVPGLTLEQRIRAARCGTEETFLALVDGARAAGAWLDRFQEFDSGSLHSAIDLLVRRADERLDGAAGAFLGRSESERVRKRIHGLAEQIASGDMKSVPHHGDFWPGNVFTSERSAYVIDFEGYRLGLPCEDLAYFLLHARLYFALRSQRQLDAIRRNFFHGYGRSVDSAAFQLARLTSALTLASNEHRSTAMVERMVRAPILREELRG